MKTRIEGLENLGGYMNRDRRIWLVGLSLFAVAACSEDNSETVDPLGVTAGFDQQVGASGVGVAAGSDGAVGTGGVEETSSPDNQAPIDSGVADGSTIVVSSGGVPGTGGVGVTAGSGGIVSDTGVAVDTGIVGDAGIVVDAAVEGGADTGPVTTALPPCITSASQVVGFGDSYAAIPVSVIAKVSALAAADGSIPAGQSYRDYSVPGTIMGSPTLPGNIPPQWDMAKAADPNITTIIMDGGGNDIIGTLLCLDDAMAQDPGCTSVVADVIAVARNMVADVKATGVADVIYFLYPDVPLGGHAILGYAVEEAKKFAAELTDETFRVHIIDTRPVFEGHPEYFGLDPIHANEAGGQAIAQLIYDYMKANCIAQPVSSGCCTL